VSTDLVRPGFSRALIRTYPLSTFSYVSMGLSVITETSSHIRHDDVFLQEHSAHPVNTYE
jgi:hypothetical protein